MVLLTRLRKRDIHDVRPAAEIYTALRTGEIRLIEIQGRNERDIWECTLKHTLLSVGGRDVDNDCLPLRHSAMMLEDNRCHGYFAISYTWNVKDSVGYGSRTSSPAVILLNGVKVSISAKVVDIIALMYECGRMDIWIDAICIDQSNMAEKDQQVRLMGQVYFRAVEVVCILGSPTRATDHAIDAANNLATGLCTHIDRAGKVYRGLLELFANKYWQRAWILQEISLGRAVSLICGSRTTSLQTLQKAMTDVDLPGGLNQWQHLRLVPYIRRLEWGGFLLFAQNNPMMMPGPTVSGSILEVLRYGRTFNKCSNPRDLLYSRISLVSDGDILIPRPDYASPVADVFKAFARNCIMLTGSLEVVALARPNALKLPSWVPDWTVATEEKGWQGTQYKFQDTDRHLWEEKDLPQVSPWGSELTVQGKCLHIVTGRESLSSLFKASNEALRSRISRSEDDGLRHYGSSADPREWARPGDLLCLLRGCPYGVYLRGHGTYFYLAARDFVQNPRIETPYPHKATFGGTIAGDHAAISYPWDLVLDVGYINSCTERVFRIK